MGVKATRFSVHVVPRASRDEVLGVRMDPDGLSCVELRVSSPPEGGRANTAVCKLLAKQLGIPKSSVLVKRGETARYKTVEAAVSSDEFSAWISSLTVL